jgi:hypothetical protein
MRPWDSRLSARGASIVAATLLLCLGVFLSWSTADPDISVGPTGTGITIHADRGTTGDEYPIGASHLSAVPEGAEDPGKGPVKASLLTALLIMAFFAVAARWLLTCGWRPGVFDSWRFAVRPHFLTARMDTPFLEVFRL